MFVKTIWNCWLISVRLYRIRVSDWVFRFRLCPPNKIWLLSKISWGHLRCHRKKHQITVHYKLCNTLRHMFVHAEDKTLRHKLDNAVYDIQCRQDVAQTKTYQQEATTELSTAHWSQITQGEKGEFVFFGNMSHRSKRSSWICISS